MKNIKHVCFDLDGTLMDSYPTILKSTIKTLEVTGITAPLHEPSFRARIGHHFLDIFNELNIPVTDIEQFINIYKSFYFNFIDHSILYGGVRQLLQQLKNRNIYISLLTTKAQDQAELILNHFNLTNYFSFIMGRRVNIPIKPSPQPLLIICKALKVEPSQTLMVGDSELDIRCAKAAAAISCGVTFGYRTEAQIAAEAPDHIIRSYSDLPEILNRINNSL